LVRTPGGFVIETDGQNLIEAHASEQGWRLEREPDIRTWTLTRSPEGGLVLCDRLDNELGRTMPLSDPSFSGRYVMLDDGRLFRIVLRGPVDARFELQGWETSGPYLLGRAGVRGWVIVPMPAAGGLTGLAGLAILFAAEILESEEPALAWGHEQA
jgi:hypothetical protein